MPLQNQNAIAIVLRQTKFGEKDTILHLLSDTGAALKVVAKGARRPGSKLTALVEPANIIMGQFHFSKNYKAAELGVLQEATAFESMASSLTDTDKFACATLVLEIVDVATRDGEPEPRLFALCRRSLQAIGETSGQLLLMLTSVAIIKIMSQIGYMPSLHLCAECSSVTNSNAVCYEAGGVVCRDCCAKLGQDTKLYMEPTEQIDHLIKLTFAEIIEQSSTILSHCQPAGLLKFAQRWTGAHLHGKVKSWRAVNQLF